MRAKELATFIKAREAARIWREMPEGDFKDRQRTKLDPIIQKYRFCNMVRADDRVTKAIFEWAQRWSTHEDLWFAFVVARLFNNPDTLDAIAPFVLPFRPDKMQTILKFRKQLGVKNFNAAYIVSTNGIAMDKVNYLLERVLKPLWKKRGEMRPRPPETLATLHARLETAQGLGSFMAAQVIADLKYFPPFYEQRLAIPTAEARDWWTFAASGPGSRRGLNRVMGRPFSTSWREAAWRAQLGELQTAMLKHLPVEIGGRMSAQDLQNALCEFDKYERARMGEGEPKQLYTPYQEN